MQQRVQILHRRDTPSSATQLPIVAALHAEDLTLFAPILQDTNGNVKCFLIFLYQLTKCFFSLFSISLFPKFLLGKTKQMCYDIQ